MGFSKLRTESHVRITFSVSLYLCNGYYTLPYFDRTIKFFRLDELLLLLLFFFISMGYAARCAIESMEVLLINSILNKYLTF